MAKKKANRIRKTSKSCQSEMINAPDSKENCVFSWLNSVEIFVSQGQRNKAANCLTEQNIQEVLSQIDSPQKHRDAYYQIATMLYRIGHRDEALSYCTKALEIAQGADAYNLMGLIHLDLSMYQKAINNLHKAKELDPFNQHACNNLAMSLMKIGQSHQAIEQFREIIQNNPDFKEAHSNLLLNLNYLPETTCNEMFEEAQQWAQSHAATSPMAHHNTLDPNKKLRIGYISPDFKGHPVMYFFDSLLTGHNRKQFELFGYGNVANPDEVTESVIKRFGHYHNILGMPDEQVASLIQSEKIDILVELAGHTQHSRLGVLAYKPAPIQMTYLGYPNTTGMSQVDYRLTDAIADSPEQQQYYSEKLIYLPNGFLCYNPGDVQPTITATPGLTNGYITFGSFNNVSKVNTPLLTLWVKILNAVPNSKLLMKFGEANNSEVCNIYLQKFIELGLVDAQERIVFSRYLPSPKHLELYNAIDIALDTFPYNGTTTTFQALLMGVPVITLFGEHHASRVGLDILTRLDLQFFAAQTTKEYVKKAVALAMKPDAINQIRATMRQRLATSPCCNTKVIINDIEKAYRKTWEHYCKTKIKEKWDQHVKKISPKTINKLNDSDSESRGVFYTVWGNSPKVEASLQRSIESVKRFHPDLPIHIDRCQNAGFINKANMFDLSPFEETVFLDTDTVVLGPLDFGFKKAKQFGLACCLNENPWAKRYCDEHLCGDMIEYNTGVLFFTKKAEPFFKEWKNIYENTDNSIFHFVQDELSYMPDADQGSFALAMEKNGFNPFILPHNWNFRPNYHAHFFGPIKIWHGYDEVPQAVHDWNAEQTAENAVIKAVTDRGIIAGQPAS